MASKFVATVAAHAVYTCDSCAEEGKTDGKDTPYNWNTLKRTGPDGYTEWTTHLCPDCSEEAHEFALSPEK